MEGPMNLVLPLRKIAHRTRGYGHGPIVRLMSPSDLGEELKPFVFLDLFEADMRNLAGSMPVHPHSGIATVTVFTTGDVTFDDPHLGHGTIGYGDVEWVRAGRGMWHGKELSAGSSAAVQGFQLWIALPPDLENAEPEVQYVGTGGMPIIGPARLIVGAYAGARSPVRSPHGVNYLLTSLKPGERWTYEPPLGHLISWVAVGKGALTAGGALGEGGPPPLLKRGGPKKVGGPGRAGGNLLFRGPRPPPNPRHPRSHSRPTAPPPPPGGGQ